MLFEREVKLDDDEKIFITTSSAATHQHLRPGLVFLRIGAMTLTLRAIQAEELGKALVEAVRGARY